MKPLVGVMPLWDDDKESIWMLPGYLDGIEEAGATPIIFPMVEAEDGIIEAVCRTGNKFLWAVQWHPEFSFKVDESSRRIFRAFVEAQLRNVLGSS